MPSAIKNSILRAEAGWFCKALADGFYIAVLAPTGMRK
jgi:hypothetical protein